MTPRPTGKFYSQQLCSLLLPLASTLLIGLLLPGCNASSINTAKSALFSSDETTPPSGASAGDLENTTFIPNPQAQAELLPDPSCKVPTEKFNVFEKAADYGGEKAVLRLKRLLDTNFKYSNLTPADKAFLKYLAYTTIWIPVELENKIGELYNSMQFNSKDEMTSRAVKRASARVDKLKAQAVDYPGTPRLLVLKSDSDSASARLGGLIVMGPSFLSLLDENPDAADLVYAHELSHIYKRHQIKEYQYQMLSSAEGFELAKKLLARDVAPNAIKNTKFVLITVPEVYNFVRKMHVQFTKDQESEADACSTVWMSKAGIDLTTAWTGFKKIQSTAGEGNQAYFAAHPLTEDREKNFIEAAKRQMQTEKK